MNITIQPDVWARMSWHSREKLRVRLEREAAAVAAAEAAAQARLASHRVAKALHTREADWSDDELRAAHAAWNRNERDDWSREGERVYQKRRHARRSHDAATKASA